MIFVERLRDELPTLPIKGEEFPVRHKEATVGYILVEEVYTKRRSDGTETVRIIGFG